MIFVHGILLLTSSEKLSEIGAGPKFALSVLTRTASLWLAKLLFFKCEWIYSFILPVKGKGS